MKLKNILPLAAAILISEGAGIIGSLFTSPSIPGWFSALSKPWFNPPSWLFSPVWTVLYLLMGVSAYLIWQKGWKKPQKKALQVFGIQLALNTAWSIIFFGLHQQGWAFLEIVALWAAIVWTIALFSKISKPAAWLLAPYLAWVSFAAILNFELWRLN